MLFAKITAVYSENHRKTINKHYEQNAKLINSEADGSTRKIPLPFKETTRYWQFSFLW